MSGNRISGLDEVALGLPRLNQVRSESLAYGATITPDFTKSNHKDLGALTGAITVANPAAVPPAGELVSVAFLQDGTGARAVSWGNKYIFSSAWSNTGNTAGKRSQATFRSDGTLLWALGVNSWA